MQCIKLIVMLPLLLLLPSTYLIQSSVAQFVQSYNDYQHNHLDDKVHYNYRYYVANEESGVFVVHVEERRGNGVQGHYALLEPDGVTVRNVYYEVDGMKGFRSIVRTHSATSNVHQMLQVSRNQPIIPITHAQPVAFII